MKKSAVLFLTLLLYVLFGPVISAYADNLVIPDTLQEMDLSNHMEVYLDHDRLNEAQILDKRNQFVPLQEANPSGDISDTVYWLKVSLDNKIKRQQDFLLEIQKPHLSSVTLYTLKNDRLQKEETIGYRYPFDKRNYKHRNLVFPLNLLPDVSTTYFLKIETDSFFQAPVSLWNPIAFSEANYMNQSILGIFYGIMLAMILYNAFLYLSLKEKSYLYYILFVSGFTVMQAVWDGFAFQFLWGDFPWWALRSNSFFIIWTSLFALLFAKHFLQLKEHSSVLYKLVTVFQWVCGLSLILPFFVSIGVMTMIGTVMAAGFVLFLIIIAVTVRLKTREARFYLTAWSLLFIGVLLNILAAFQLLPLTDLTLYAPKVGIAFEVLVLSLGLADRIKRTRKEKAYETKKYYVHTLLQNAVQRMTEIDDFTPLSQEGLRCLMDITHFEKGFYLTRDRTGWNVVSKVNVEADLEDFYIDQYASFQNGRSGIMDGSTFTVPITSRSHTGCFIVWSSQEEVDLSIMESFLPAFIEQFSALVTQKEYLNELRKSAMVDDLTDLLNRKYFLEKVSDIHNGAEQASLLLIDIDHFKNINDRYGHLIGDEAIVFATGLIKKVFHEKGIIGRFGGEEFIVFLRNVEEHEALEGAQSLLEVFRQEGMPVDDYTSIYLTVSIGFCISQPNSCLTMDEMIQRADEKLYLAKRNGRDQVAV
ncbi:GGDEF domain-containing protein [Bacillus sp. NTK074B]|uniref:sensor domain-containing diguanylate cyclase n=1 Tax=Bacillus sp. NTK074B TaxID=2802174 RepID=UPI001A908310|nr:GGDEF domain-containing protein [Bacillus sp. NTK074B]